MTEEATTELENTETATPETATPSTEAALSPEEQTATPEVEKTEAEIEAEKQRNQQFALRRTNAKSKKENRQLKARISELESKASETKAPIAENYENYDDFIKASIDHGIKQGKPKEEYNPVSDYASELTAQGTDKYPDFVQKAYATNEMLPVLEEFDNAIDIAMHLGQNPQVAQRIQQMSNVGMAREFAKIEAEINKPAIRTTTAPKPVKSIETASSTSADTSKMSMAEYAAFRNKQQYG